MTHRKRSGVAQAPAQEGARCSRLSHDAASALLKVSGNWRRSEAAFSRNMTKWSRANHKPTGREHRLWFWVVAGLGIVSTTSWLTLCFYSKTIEPLMLSQGCESVPRNITNKLIIISSHEQSCTRSPSCAVFLSKPNVRNLYVNSEARENFDLWHMWTLFLHLCLHGFVHVPNNSLKPVRQRKQEVTWPHRNAELDHLVLWGLLRYWKQLWQHSYLRRQQPHDGRTGSEVNDDIRRKTFVFVANMKM